MENRRTFERFGADMIFWIKPLDGDEDFQPFEIENISAGGILCVTVAELDQGSIVELSFELPQVTDLISAKAEVRHREDFGEKYRVGLQFSSVEGLSTQQLLTYLEELFR